MSHNGCLLSGSTGSVGGSSGSDCSGGSCGGGFGKAMLGPARRLCTPDRHLMVLIAICKLVRAAVVDIEALAHLREVSRSKRTLSDF